MQSFAGFGNVGPRKHYQDLETDSSRVLEQTKILNFVFSSRLHVKSLKVKMRNKDSFFYCF